MTIFSDVHMIRRFLKLCHITKGSILSLVSTIFNPFINLTPGMLQPKSIVQGFWKGGLDWDKDIPLILKNT